MEPRQILIVANQTAAGEPVKRVIGQRMADGPCMFTLLVPASPPHGTATWTEGQARATAEQRMNDALGVLRGLGATVAGVVGDANPVQAIDDVMMHATFDEIVISTLPTGTSKWVRQDVPHKVQRRHPTIAVMHVVDEEAPVKAT